MVSETFRKLTSLGAGKGGSQKVQSTVSKPAPVQKKREEPIRREPSTPLEDKIETNAIKSVKTPIVIILSILGVLLPYVAVIIMYGPTGGYLDADSETLLILGPSLVLISLIFLITIAATKKTGAITLLRKLVYYSFFVMVLLTVAMMFLKASYTAFVALGSAVEFLIFNRVFARKRILEY
jgi:hypothetical protein